MDNIYVTMHSYQNDKRREEESGSTHTDRCSPMLENAKKF